MWFLSVIGLRVIRSCLSLFVQSFRRYDMSWRFWLYGRLGRAAERECTERNATDRRTPCRNFLATPLRSRLTRLRKTSWSMDTRFLRYASGQTDRQTDIRITILRTFLLYAVFIDSNRFRLSLFRTFSRLSARTFHMHVLCLFYSLYYCYTRCSKLCCVYVYCVLFNKYSIFLRERSKIALRK